MTEYAPTSVSKWTRPRGYDLWLCELTLHPLSLQYTLVCGALLEFQRYLREECSHTVEVEPREVALYVYGDLQRYIVIPQNAWTPDDHGTISHELHHATHLGLESNGITGNDELYAYVQGYLAELVVRAFLELPKTRKSWSK